MKYTLLGSAATLHTTLRAAASRKKIGEKHMELQDYREQIDAIDDEMLKLFKERMDISLVVCKV